MVYFIACFDMGAQKNLCIPLFSISHESNLFQFVLNQNSKWACSIFTLSIFILSLNP